ncbi:MAG: hypothetical protein QXO67_00430 [Candidatus Bathyarchaeia archaeon]
MAEKWVERIRYSSGFASEEEARKFLEEGLKWFEEMDRQMRTFHERMLSWMSAAFKPFYPTEYAAKPEDLIAKIERLENELKEVKELIKRKYGLAKVEIH